MNFDLCGVAKLSNSSKKILKKENFCCFFLNFARVNDGIYIPSDKKANLGTVIFPVCFVYDLHLIRKLESRFDVYGLRHP